MAAALDQVSNEDGEIAQLNDALSKAPVHLAMFSTALISLFNEHEISGTDEGTQTFICIRDKVRSQAVVYANAVLPSTQNTFFSLSSFMDYFHDLDYDEWESDLEAIILELDEAKSQIDIVASMHNAIIDQLRENEKEAEFGMDALNELVEMYKVQREHFLKEAKRYMYKELAARVLPILLFPTSFSIAFSIAYPYQVHCHEQHKFCRLSASLSNLKANKTANIVAIIENFCILAIKDFIVSIENCRDFILKTKLKLEKMKKAGDKGKMKLHYKTMKYRAKEVSDLCEQYIIVSEEVRKILMKIPRKHF